MSSAHPITEFLNAAERATAHQVDTAPAALATADTQGRPSVRIVLVRAVGFFLFAVFLVWLLMARGLYVVLIGSAAPASLTAFWQAIVGTEAGWDAPEGTR